MTLLMQESIKHRQNNDAQCIQLPEEANCEKQKWSFLTKPRAWVNLVHILEFLSTEKLLRNEFCAGTKFH